MKRKRPARRERQQILSLIEGGRQPLKILRLAEGEVRILRDGKAIIGFNRYELRRKLPLEVCLLVDNLLVLLEVYAGVANAAITLELERLIARSYGGFVTALARKRDARKRDAVLKRAALEIRKANRGISYRELARLLVERGHGESIEAMRKRLARLLRKPLPVVKLGKNA